MSAEKVIRVKVSIPEGVVVRTSFRKAQSNLFNIPFFEEFTERFSAMTGAERAADAYRASVPIELTLEVPEAKRKEVAQLFHNLSMEISEA